jgi:signal transduction histidine kinase
MTSTDHDTQAGPVPGGPGRSQRVPQNDPVSTPGAPGRWSAAVLPLLSVALLVVTVAYDVLTPSTGPGVELAPGYGWPYAGIGLVFGVCCGVVLWHDARQPLGWGLGAVALLWGVDGWAQAYVRFGISVDDVSPGVNAALWILNRFGAFLPATVAVLLVLFPTGRFLAGAWGRISQVALVAMTLAALVVVLAPANGRVGDVALPPGVDLDAGSVPMSPDLVDVAIPVVGLLTIAGLLVSMATVGVRYRRATGLDRDRLRWLLWSVVAMAVVIGLSAVSDLGAARDASIFVIASLPPVAITIGIVRPTLVPVVDLLNGTVVFAVLSAVLVVVDLGVVAALDLVLDDSLDQRQVVLIVLLLTVLLYGPLRQRLTAVVRRLVFGERGRPYDVVAGLASTLEQADDGEEQLAVVAEAVASAFGISYVCLEVDRAHGERLVATHGTAPSEVRTLPITYRGEDVGRVVLPVRGLRSRLSRRDEQLLGDLARQAATAVRTSQLADELQENRERLVAAREEERRRIRRDLHDGLGPSLSGVVFQLESARLQVDRDPAAAQRSIAATSTLVQDVVADVRRLVHDLRPPALDDLGLVGALRQQADRMTRDGLAVTVDGTDLGQLSAAVEVAAFRIAGEALTNVSRHASATHVTARLRVQGDELLVEVVDDGVGIPPDVQAGVGLVSLRERAAELGGRTEVSCPATGGTVVRAWLPLSRSGRTDRMAGRPADEREDEQ